MRLILSILSITFGLLIGWTPTPRSMDVTPDVSIRTVVQDKSVEAMKTSTHTTDAPVLHLPVKGTWRLIRSPGHDEYAFDLAAADVASHRTMDRSRLQHLLGRVHVEDTYSWNEPVFAPTGGIVVQAASDQPDRERLSLLRDMANMVFAQPEMDPEDISPFAGNYLIIRADGFYVFLAHMQEGSVTVQEGDEVEAGQLLGRVGNSGHSLEPHLHFQLFDQIDDLLSAGAPPFVISQYERWTGSEWEAVEHEALSKGDVVRSREEKEAHSAEKQL